MKVYAPRIVQQTGFGNFIVEAWTWHLGQICECRFKVTPQGVVEMNEDNGMIEVMRVQ